MAMSTTNLLVAESRNFCFKWRHQDGSIVEFNSSGWASNDPLKVDWLLKMNELCSSKPTICPAVRFWLREYCELIDFRCSERMEANGPRVPAHSSPSLARVSSLGRNSQSARSPKTCWLASGNISTLESVGASPLMVPPAPQPAKNAYSDYSTLACMNSPSARNFTSLPA
jgi:hypothetical protein